MNPIDSLWQASPRETLPNFCQSTLPDLAKQYLRHAIAPERSPASVVRLEMVGEIKLKNWMPFTAALVVRGTKGFVWSARARMKHGFISGYDRYLEGVGEMRWKLVGLFPVMSASGSDVTRSAADRFALERVFLPSSFCGSSTTWSAQAQNLELATTGLSPIHLDLEASGRIRTISMDRWGNPDGGAFGLTPFGGIVDEEATWDGYTIPSRLRIGWHWGTNRFAEGEFFRAKITSAEFK